MLLRIPVLYAAKDGRMAVQPHERSMQEFFPFCKGDLPRTAVYVENGSAT
jgi:hypothetical protein